MEYSNINFFFHRHSIVLFLFIRLVKKTLIFFHLHTKNAIAIIQFEWNAKTIKINRRVNALKIHFQHFTNNNKKYFHLKAEQKSTPIQQFTKSHFMDDTQMYEMAIKAN